MQFYSDSFIGDMREVVQHVGARYPNANLYAVGWSLGANILVNYLAQVSFIAYWFIQFNDFAGNVNLVFKICVCDKFKFLLENMAMHIVVVFTYFPLIQTNTFQVRGTFMEKMLLFSSTLEKTVEVEGFIIRYEKYLT